MAIDVVRGALDEHVASEVLAFWDAHGALTGDAARERLAKVVCVLRDDAGAVAGISSAEPTRVPLVGNRAFWLYNSFSTVPAQADALRLATFERLQTEHRPGDGGPVGLCVTITDPAEILARREAIWPGIRLFYVGYHGDAQVRIRYFEGARVGHG